MWRIGEKEGKKEREKDRESFTKSIVIPVKARYGDTVVTYCTIFV